MGGFKQLIYVDGFAGPGRYANGEDGSPLIALKAALVHRDRITADVWFLFIERDITRAKMLEDRISCFARVCGSSSHVVVFGAPIFHSLFAIRSPPPGPASVGRGNPAFRPTFFRPKRARSAAFERRPIA